MTRILAKLIAGTSAITLVTYVAAMALSIALVVFTSVGQDFLHHDGPIRIGFFLLVFDTGVRVNLLAGFLVLLGIYSLCFVAAFWSRGGYLHSMRNVITGSSRSDAPNWFVVMPAVSSALLLGVVLLSFILVALGLPIGSLPQLDLYALLYNLAYAGPVEETMFRISTLGLLVAVRILWARVLSAEKSSPRRIARLVGLSFFWPDRAKSEAGLPTVATSRLRGIHYTEWAGVIVTSVGFGIAHYESKIGWDVGKIITAGTQGAVLGIAFLAYGAYASILLHWFFDLYSGTFYAISNLFGGGYSVLDPLVSLWSLTVGVIGIIAIRRWSRRGRPIPIQTPYMTPTSWTLQDEGSLHHRQVE